MRYTSILCFTLFACNTGLEGAPEADPTETEKTLARRVASLEAFATRAISEMELMKTENQRLQSELDGHVTVLKASLQDLGKTTDGHVTVLKAAGTDLSDGTCATTREAGSGMATGRRQYRPLIVNNTDHPSGDPHLAGDPVHGVDVKLGLVDADGDGDVDYLALEADIDGDGFDELVELGGDRDDDGNLEDDALEADRANDAAATLVCGATDHF